MLVHLGIQVQLLKNDYRQEAGQKAGYVIVLQSQINTNEADNKASFQYWTCEFPELDGKPVNTKELTDGVLLLDYP